MQGVRDAETDAASSPSASGEQLTRSSFRVSDALRVVVMNRSVPTSFEIDADLTGRLEALARREGTSIEELVESVLRAHAEAAESGMLDHEDDDERRWQNYLQSGRTVSFETVRERLRILVERAGSATTSR